MVRLRLFYGLLTIILLLWGVGATALLLMRDSVTRFDNRLRVDYRAIDSAQAIRTLTATLNARYLPSLAGPPPAQAPDRLPFRQLKKQLQDQLAIIRSDSNDDPRWRDVLTKLEAALTIYLAGYEEFFRNTTMQRADREKLLQSQSTLTQQPGHAGRGRDEPRRGQAVFRSHADRRGIREKQLVRDRPRPARHGIAALVYFQLVRHLVDPVANLHRSMEEIRKGNFELTLPEPPHGSEFSKVTTAFNAMAAELKIWRGESPRKPDAREHGQPRDPRSHPLSSLHPQR